MDPELVGWIIFGLLALVGILLLKMEEPRSEVPAKSQVQKVSRE
jgi:hypothetical protein